MGKNSCQSFGWDRYQTEMLWRKKLYVEMWFFFTWFARFHGTTHTRFGLGKLGEERLENLVLRFWRICEFRRDYERIIIEIFNSIFKILLEIFTMNNLLEMIRNAFGATIHGRGRTGTRKGNGIRGSCGCMNRSESQHHIISPTTPMTPSTPLTPSTATTLAPTNTMTVLCGKFCT